MAHLALADAHARLQQRAEARHALRNAARLLERMPPGEPVHAADGETAGRLVELVRVRSRLLEEAT
jgi:hypothetical protein